MKKDGRDIERAIEEHRRRIFDAPTEQERKKAERELAEHIARPGLTDDIDELAREFEIRLKRAVSFPPDTPAEYKEAFAPFLERVATIQPHNEWEVIGWDLWTQHMVQISFAYGVEPLFAQLGLKVFGLLSPPPAIFEEATADPDEVERARKRREFVESVEASVVGCVQAASGYFVEAFRGRLGTALDQTLNEIAVRAISEMTPNLNNTGEKHISRLREIILKEWTAVEKVRIGTPPQGGSRAKADLSRLKEYFDEHIGAVKEAWDDCRQALSSRSPNKRRSWPEDIKRNFPQLADHEDLITLLQPATEWPEDLADVCVKKEIDSDPEHICLALAARLCGSTGFQHKVSTLREYVRRQGRKFQSET